MKIIFQLVPSFCVLLMGCAANKEKIVFSDEPSAHLTSTAAVVTAPARKLDEADKSQIEKLVFSNLLERHFWDLSDYSATFLQASDSEVAALMKEFPAHVPPIKPSHHAEVAPGRAPRDKDTGRPAMILSVVVDDPEAEDSVMALGRWFAGEAVTGFYRFHFKKTAGEWKIDNVQ